MLFSADLSRTRNIEPVRTVMTFASPRPVDRTSQYSRFQQTGFPKNVSARALPGG